MLGLDVSARSESLQFVTGRDFLGQQIDAPRWLVDNVLSENSCMFVAGAPKSGKSWITLDLAMAVASGGDFLGRTVDRPGRVLLLDAETPAGHQADIERLQEAIMLRQPTLIILDCLIRFHQRDENSAQEMAAFLGDLRELTRLPGASPSLVVVHHTIKSAGANGSRLGAGLRGSGDLWGWYDSAVFVKRDGTKITADFESRHCADQPALDINLTITEDRASVTPVGLPLFKASRADAVLSVLERAPERARAGAGAISARWPTAISSMTAARPWSATIWRAARRSGSVPPGQPRTTLSGHLSGRTTAPTRLSGTVRAILQPVVTTMLYSADNHKPDHVRTCPQAGSRTAGHTPLGVSGCPVRPDGRNPGTF